MILGRRTLATFPGGRPLPGRRNLVLSRDPAFAPQGAAVTASTCPDQVCVQTGQLTRAGESAICLPARVTLRLEGGGDSVDATVY